MIGKMTASPFSATPFSLASCQASWKSRNKKSNERKYKLKFRKWFRYGLKAQKLLAQGIALGIIAANKAPCKGKSFVIRLVF